MCDYFAKKIEKKRFFDRVQTELPFFGFFSKATKKNRLFRKKKSLPIIFFKNVLALQCSRHRRLRRQCIKPPTVPELRHAARP